MNSIVKFLVQVRTELNSEISVHVGIDLNEQKNLLP
jgi:hypothetical protein